MVWGDGHPLLHPVVAVVDPARREALGEFAQRAVLTLVPFADWGHKERALQDFFLLLPADLPGQVRLMQALAEGQTRQDAYLRAQALDPGVGLQDLRSIAKLRACLADDDLVQWLGAVALYPRLRWEVVVEMGRAVLPPERLNFSNLLKLVRIPWMHEGALPDRTRLELLKLLTPDNEVKARETLLRMLDQGERYFPGERLFGEAKHLLQTTNRFTLYAHDANRYAGYAPALNEFRTLRGKRLLPDRTMGRYLENEGRAWRTAFGSSEPAIPAMSLHPDSVLTRLVREIGELEAEAARLRQEEEEAFQRGREELASGLNVSRKAVESQLAEAKRRFDPLRESGGETAGTSLADYFANLPPDPPAPKPRDPLRLPLLATAIGLVGLLLGLWYFRTTPGARELDPAQEIPLTVLLDSNACVTDDNTRPYRYPRWTVALNDSLVSLTNLRGTRAFSLAELQNSGSTGGGWDDEPSGSRAQNWFSTAFRPVPDSLQLYVTLAVRDTGSAPAQSRFVALAGDTLTVSITCPEVKTSKPTPAPTDSAQSPVTARLRVDVFYSEESQAATQRIARKLAQGLQSSNQYDVQVKLLRTAINQQRYYLVSRNEIRFDAEERDQALQLKATAEAISRTYNITFAPYGVSRPQPGKNYVSLFIVIPGAAGNPFVCQPVSTTWLSRFDGAYLNTRAGLYRFLAKGTSVRINVEDAMDNVGTTTANVAGTVRRVCQQKGVYLVLSNGSKQALLARPGPAKRIDLAIVVLNPAYLDATDGQAYFDKLVQSASFRAYTIPSEPPPNANDAAQTAAPVWRQLGRVQFANPSQDDWASLNELARANPGGRLRVVINCDEKEYPAYRDRAANALPAAANRIEFLNRPLDPKAQAYQRPYAEIFGSGLTPPASAK